MNFQCPQLAPGSPLNVTVDSENGVAQQAAPSVMVAASPGIFTVDATNQGVVQIAATNEIAMTSKTGIRSRPAAQGETLTIYAIGLGPVTDDVSAESTTLAGPQTRLAYPVRVSLGDTYIDPMFTGPAPGSAGLYQISVAVPPGVPSGPAVPLHVEVNLPSQTSVSSNTVTVALQ